MPTVVHMELTRDISHPILIAQVQIVLRSTEFFVRLV